jgi:Zn-finger nucleic acid-binding protein
MTCPKCEGEMRSHERNGVTIEQCRKCHGIFLDAGEFEQLLGREMSPLGRESADGEESSRWRPWRR